MVMVLLLAILGKMVGSIDKTGKLLTIINKISSIIIIIVALMILQNLFNYYSKALCSCILKALYKNILVSMYNALFIINLIN